MTITYTTFDPATKPGEVTLSGGNLIATKTAGTTYGVTTKSVLARSSGKLYAEFTVNALAAALNPFIGIVPDGIDTTGVFEIGWDGGDDGWSYYGNDGKKAHSAAMAAYGASYGVGAIISVVFDIDAGSLSFWKNGVDQGVAYSGLPADGYYIGISQYGTTPQATVNFGATGFAYTPPAGYEGWGTPEPSTGNGAGTLQQLTATGSRIAAGAGTMAAMTATGGYNGLGAVTLELLVVVGSGGNPVGAGTMQAMTASGTGSQAARGAVTLSAFTASATGYDSEIWTFAGSAKPPILSSSILTGEIITVIGNAVVPLLVAEIDNPAVITASLIAPLPRLVLTGLRGNVATILASAVAPTLIAAGYPAFTITFAGSVPAPRLVSVLSGPASTNYRAWCLNTRKGVLTEYSGFEFNSFAAFNNQILAAGSSGIVVLGTQGLDNATVISSTVKSGKDNFASSVLKRIPRIYINYTTDGDAQFKLITTEGGSRTYALNWNHGTGVQTRRIPVGKGPKSARWQWEYTNVGGADFDLGAVLAYPTKLRRRV